MRAAAKTNAISADASRDERSGGEAPSQALIRLLLTNIRVQVGVVIVGILVVVGLFGPLFSPYPPSETHILKALEAPSAQHWFGTDHIGRDVLSRVIYGARISLLVGISSVLIAVGVGLPLGMIAGFFGGALDQILGRITDIFLAFPPILLAIFLASLSQPGLLNIIFPIALVYIPVFLRLARGEVLRARELEFVHAAQALGARVPRILVQHILPSIVSPILVQAILAVAMSILTESTLSFLGLGPQPPTATWGGLLSDGRAYMTEAPWLTIFPGLAIVLVVSGFSMLGDAARDSMDPKLRGIMQARRWLKSQPAHQTSS